MSTEDQSAAPDAPGKTESQSETTEQTTTESSFVDELFKQAKADGHQIFDSKAEPEPEPVEAIAEGIDGEEPVTETEADPEPKEELAGAETEEPEEVEAKKDEKLVPLSEVLEERAKKKRANERAEKLEAENAQLQAQLAQAIAPAPTENNPFIDVQNMNELDKLENSYEKAIELADENPDGAESVVVRYGNDGKPIREDLTAEQLVLIKRKAEKAIRRQIPERRKYLEQRATYDQQAAIVYPELKNPESEFTKVAATMAYNILSGRAQNDPQLLIYVADAAAKYLERIKANGKNGQTPSAKTPEAKIIESSRTKIAPTPTRTRSYHERRGSDNLEKLKTKFEERGDSDSALEYLNALRTKNEVGTKRLEPIVE